MFDERADRGRDYDRLLAGEGGRDLCERGK